MKNVLTIIGGLSILGTIGFVVSSFRPNYSIFKRAKKYVNDEYEVRAHVSF